MDIVSQNFSEKSLLEEKVTFVESEFGCAYYEHKFINDEKQLRTYLINFHEHMEFLVNEKVNLVDVKHFRTTDYLRG